MPRTTTTKPVAKSRSSSSHRGGVERPDRRAPQPPPASPSANSVVALTQFDFPVVDVRPSTYPSFGRGLFARVTVPAHTFLCFYSGDDERPADPGRAGNESDRWFEAPGANEDARNRMDGTALGHFANSPANTGRESNAACIVLQIGGELGQPDRFGRIGRVALVSKTRIEEGEEVFVDYGRFFQLPQATVSN